MDEIPPCIPLKTGHLKEEIQPILPIKKSRNAIIQIPSEKPSFLSSKPTNLTIDVLPTLPDKRTKHRSEDDINFSLGIVKKAPVPNPRSFKHSQSSSVENSSSIPSSPAQIISPKHDSVVNSPLVVDPSSPIETKLRPSKPPRNNLKEISTFNPSRITTQTDDSRDKKPLVNSPPESYNFEFSSKTPDSVTILNQNDNQTLHYDKHKARTEFFLGNPIRPTPPPRASQIPALYLNLEGKNMHQSPRRKSLLDLKGQQFSLSHDDLSNLDYTQNRSDGLSDGIDKNLIVNNCLSNNIDNSNLTGLCIGSSIDNKISAKPANAENNQTITYSSLLINDKDNKISSSISTKNVNKKLSNPDNKLESVTSSNVDNKSSNASTNNNIKPSIDNKNSNIKSNIDNKNSKLSDNSENTRKESLLPNVDLSSNCKPSDLILKDETNKPQDVKRVKQLADLLANQLQKNRRGASQILTGGVATPFATRVTDQDQKSKDLRNSTDSFLNTEKSPKPSLTGENFTNNYYESDDQLSDGEDVCDDVSDELEFSRPSIPVLLKSVPIVANQPHLITKKKKVPTATLR